MSTFELNRERFGKSGLLKQQKTMDRGRGWQVNVTAKLKALGLALNLKIVNWEKPKNVLQQIPTVRKSYKGTVEEELELKVVQFGGGVGRRLEADQQALWKLFFLNLERTHKQVKEHYINYLRPEIKKEDWTME